MTKTFLREKLIVCMPLFPLIDFFVFSEIPVFTFASYLLTFFVFKKNVIKCDINIFLFILISITSCMINSIQKGIGGEEIKYLVALLFFSFMGATIGKKLEYYLEALVKMVVFYFVLNTMIYMYRLIAYEFDFNRVRSGISIFGGNTVHFIYLMVLFVLKKYTCRKKEYYLILVLSVINAVMFVSKGAILLAVAWVLLDIVNQKKTHILNKKSIMFVGILTVSIVPLLKDKLGVFIKYIVERFNIWGQLYNSTGSIWGTRGKIFEFTTEYIKNNPLVILWGNGPSNFRDINPWGYSNPHNLLLDVFIDLGIVGLFVFFAMCLCIIMKSKNKIYFLACICYAIFEGISLFYIDSSSSIVAGFVFLFIIICYYDSKERYRTESLLKY